jgi:peptidoglycan/xylan/chitin deacetylase (PgdA/CDA1 family)
LTDAQVQGLAAAGWQLGAEGPTQPDLTSLDASRLSQEVTTERQTLRSRYNASINWYCYPSGRYNPAVTDAVRAAGFVGATTLTTGWASPQSNRFLLPRLQVVGGTSPTKLMSQITAAAGTTSAPTSSAGV